MMQRWRSQSPASIIRNVEVPPEPRVQRCSIGRRDCMERYDLAHTSGASIIRDTARLPPRNRPLSGSRDRTGSCEQPRPLGDGFDCHPLHDGSIRYELMRRRQHRRSACTLTIFRPAASSLSTEDPLPVTRRAYARDKASTSSYRRARRTRTTLCQVRIDKSWPGRSGTGGTIRDVQVSLSALSLVGDSTSYPAEWTWPDVDQVGVSAHTARPGREIAGSSAGRLDTPTRTTAPAPLARVRTHRTYRKHETALLTRPELSAEFRTT